MGATKTFGPVIAIMMALSPVLGQESIHCPTEVLSRIERQVGHLNKEDWNSLFGSIEPRCKGDLKFMGWVNDLLFRTLEAQPTEFMNAFDELSSVTQRMILDQLIAPGHDGLDPARTYDQIRGVAGPPQSKQRILQALTKAGCRCDTESIP